MLRTHRSKISLNQKAVKADKRLQLRKEGASLEGYIFLWKNIPVLALVLEVVEG